MINDDVLVKMMNLPTRIKAFVLNDEEGFSTIFLNAKMSHVQHGKSYRHEMEHIGEDDLYATESADIIEYKRHS